jgi:hypothetical protein
MRTIEHLYVGVSEESQSNLGDQNQTTGESMCTYGHCARCRLYILFPYRFILIYHSLASDESEAAPTVAPTIDANKNQIPSNNVSNPTGSNNLPNEPANEPSTSIEGNETLPSSSSTVEVDGTENVPSDTNDAEDPDEVDDETTENVPVNNGGIFGNGGVTQDDASDNSDNANGEEMDDMKDNDREVDGGDYDDDDDDDDEGDDDEEDDEGDDEDDEDEDENREERMSNVRGEDVDKNKEKKKNKKKDKDKDKKDKKKKKDD